MRLYRASGCGSAIIEGLLALAGLEAEPVDVSGFDEPGPARDRLGLVNPLHQVPVLLLDDGMVLTESAAIVLNLADRREGLAPPPGDPRRIRFQHLLVWLVANVYPSFTYGDYPARWAPADPTGIERSTDRHRERLYLWLERQLDGPFALGDAVCALDVYLAVLLHWRPGPDWFAAHTPRLAAIAARTRALPALVPVMAANGW